MTKRVCVIGAGPSGMSIACQYSSLREQGLIASIDLEIFEKQDKCGGLWNLLWKTGLDTNGEPVHGSMYKNLWSNGPKEGLEFPDYTFEHHFGRAIPSFPPREVMLDYLQGRWKKYGAEKFVRFEKVIRSVKFNPERKTFDVVIYDIKTDTVLPRREFDYVVNATGHFSFPNIPSFKGIESFPGRIIHAHDFRNGEEFAGMNLLIIGSSYSAEDIALQCMKFGTKRIVCSYRSAPMGFCWPENIEERPLLLEISGKKCYFKDGKVEEFDAIILATGYNHMYPWMDNDLRISCKEPNSYFVQNLYKGLLWLKGGGNQLFYIGCQDQLYTFTLFDVQAFWIVKYMSGLIRLPSYEVMMADSKSWKEKLTRTVKSFFDEAEYQISYMLDLIEGLEYPHDLDCTKIFVEWHKDKDDNILTYRDKRFQSIFTKTMSPCHHTSWVDALDDSMKTFLNT